MSPLVLQKPSLAHTCPKCSLWCKWLQDMAVEMKVCILTLYPYSNAQSPQILYCFISDFTAASRGLTERTLCKTRSLLPACKRPFTGILTMHFSPGCTDSWLLFQGIDFNARGKDQLQVSLFTKTTNLVLYRIVVNHNPYFQKQDAWRLITGQWGFWGR